jgi:hemerythrin-like domain-containing protein
MKSINLVLEDHRHILRATNVLEEMVGRVQRGQKPNGRDVNDVLLFLKGFGVRRHQAMEEGVVFPALLRGRGQKNFNEFCGLIFEHNRQRYLIEGIDAAMVTKSIKDFIHFASRLVIILRTHIQQEGEVLIALMHSMLSPSDDENLARDIEAHDRLWQEKEVPGLLRRLDTLETKYCRKALSSAFATA